MRYLWMKLRMPLAVIGILLITVLMARNFSGPEDTWIKNESGEWIAHGHPSMPMPTADYKQPLAEKVLPLVFLVSFALPLFFLGLHRQHNRLTFETASRDIKFLGYLSTTLVSFGMLIGISLFIGLCIGGEALLKVENVVFLYYMLSGFAGLCIVCGLMFFILKRNINDHYQLEKGRKELLEYLNKN